MSNAARPLLATEIPLRSKPSNYPTHFAQRVAGRQKRALGDAFGLTRYGVNLTVLSPGSQSALLHRHSDQEEFIYVLEGHPTLRTEEGQFELAPGMCIGFPANGTAHHLLNLSSEDVRYLEVGDRSEADRGEYPEDDLVAERAAGAWRFLHKDGTPWS